MSFSQKRKLKAHILKVHIDLEPKSSTLLERQKDHKCEYCGKSFFQKSKLSQHITTVHKGNKDGVCGHCGETFYHANELRNHYDSVHRVLKCHNCGLSFSQKSKLMAHIIKRDKDQKCDSQEKHIDNVHERPKPHKCDFCEKSFFQLENLKKHISSIHEGPKEGHHVVHEDHKNQILEESQFSESDSNHR